jgi:1,6-anhydro-N-acetylmuramate kinase
LVKLASLRAMTTSIQEEAISVLLEEANLKPNDVVAVAVNDPGVWVSPSEWSQKETWYSISSGKLLARRTGMNVIDSFVPADWSPKGYGRAFLALPYWILLSSKEKARLVLDVGETARWTYLPAAKSKDSWSQTYYREVAPCGSILNFFTRQATKGATLVDLGGKLSVQGRSPNELLDFWRDAQQKARCIDDLPQRYYTTSLSGTFNELFYFDTLKLTPPRKFSTLDALCGAVYWIAEEIKASLDSYHFSEPYEIVLTGATRQNGLLFSRLSTLIKQNAFHRLSEYGFIEDSFDGAAAATLGILFAANIPAAWPELHGVKSPALLGRASFGTLESSRRLLHFANRK